MTSRTVEIAGRQYKLFVTADDERVLETVLATSEDPDRHIPYWATLWPAALALAETVSGQIWPEHQNVIELGCGLGLVGMAAGQAGANIILSDNEPDALRLAELNWIVNFSEAPQITVLDWYQPARSSRQARYDVIIASDVAYDRALFHPLINTFNTLLEKSGTILLSEPQRSIAADFFKLLTESGFKSEVHEKIVMVDGRKIGVNIHQIRRQDS